MFLSLLACLGLDQDHAAAAGVCVCVDDRCALFGVLSLPRVHVVKMAESDVISTIATGIIATIKLETESLEAEFGMYDAESDEEENIIILAGQNDLLNLEGDSSDNNEYNDDDNDVDLYEFMQNHIIDVDERDTGFISPLSIRRRQSFGLIKRSTRNEKGCSKRKRRPAYAEITVPLYTDSEFRNCFHISRRACEALTRRLVPQILAGMVSKDNPIRSGRPPIPLDKKILIVLWFFANPQPFRMISERFEVAKSSVEDSFRRVIAALVEISGEYIRWPSGNYANDIVHHFREQSGLYGVLGVIGTARINIKTNKETPKAYCDSGGYSVIVQLVCDHQMLITDCFGGLPGSVSDIAVLRNSDLQSRISTDCSSLFPNDTYLLGGESLPIEPWLITPFAENEELPPAKQYFNKTLTASLNVMHRTVALLKGRFARLRLLEISRLDYLPLCVSAACVLHNACLLEDEDEINYVQEYIDAGWESMVTNEDLERSFTSTSTVSSQDEDFGADPDRWLLGCQKRNLLCNALLNSVVNSSVPLL